jgi:hypothetical protein
LKNQWIDKVIHDTYLDDIIFGYTDIFPIDEQTALANAGSKDHLDILEAAGVYIPHDKTNSIMNTGSHLTPANLNKNLSMPPLAPKNKKLHVVKTRD